jgi:hypothetical protein
MLKVDDRVWKKMMKDLLLTEKPKAQAGFFDGIAPEVYRGKSEADIMAINEFGAQIKGGGRIPPRRAIGKIARQKHKMFKRLSAMHLSRALNGGRPNLKVFGTLMKEAIANNINSPTGMVRNKKSTIRSKGFNNPLTETGHLGASVKDRVTR